MIYWKTGLTEIPPNCADCKLEWCPYPLKADGMSILKSCVNKRHSKCPLVEVTEETK